MILIILTTLSLIVFTWKILRFIIRYITIRSILKRQRIKGPDDLFIIGNAHQLERDLVLFHSQLLKYSESYRDEKFFLIWIGPQAYIFCHHPQSVEAILSSNKMLTKADFYSFLEPWLGDSLVLSTGRKWRSRRKSMTPAFHFKILLDYLPIFNKNARILVDAINSKSSMKQSVDTYKLMSMATLDNIVETAMGASIDAQINGDSEYVKAVLFLSEAIIMRFKNPLLANDTLFKWSKTGRQFYNCLDTVNKYISHVIQERTSQRERRPKEELQLTADGDHHNSKKRLSFLDILLEQQEEATKSEYPITEEDIKEEVSTFMFAGFESTATATTMVLYLLAKHPHVLKKVQEELDEIFRDEKEREITDEDLQRMNYLDLVIKEAARIYSTVPFIGRKLLTDIELCGYNIPKGANLIVYMYGLHLREDFYTDAKTFKPERFENRTKTEGATFGYVPFSAGPRNCIGFKFALMEEKVLLAAILRKFELNTNLTEEDLKLSSQLALKPHNPINIDFTMRQ